MGDNERFLSEFERREKAREAEGLSGWSTQVGELGQQAVFEGRIDGQPDWGLRAVFDIELPGVPLVELSFIRATLSPPPNGITVDVLRSLRVGPLHAAVRAWLQLPPNAGPGIDVDRNELGGPRRPGRRGRPDSFYAEWAARYVTAMREEGPPLPRLREEYDFDMSTIRGFLYEARRRGLLTRAPSGRAGGELTAKARGLLPVRSGTD
jgi:hypothetical protein